VALLLGGEGLAKGAAAPDPLSHLPAQSQATIFDQRKQKVGSQINIKKMSGGFVQQGWNVPWRCSTGRAGNPT